MTRKIAAAEIVLTALRWNVARTCGRAVVASLRQLRNLEAAIEAVPGLTLAEAGGLDKASTKARLVFEHTLEKLVLSADNIPTRGSETARAIRKRLVLRANARLQAHDELTQKARAEAAAQQIASDVDSSTDVGMDTASLNGEPDVGPGEAGEPVAQMDIEPTSSNLTICSPTDIPGAAAASSESETLLQQVCQRFGSELARLEATEGNSGHFRKTLKTLQDAILAAQRRLLVTTSTV